MMPAKKKVLFITDGIFPHSIGGMQRHSALLIKTLAETSKLEIVVVHPHTENAFPSELGIQEIKIPFDFTGLYAKKCLEYSGLTAEVIRQHPEAIVYSQGLSVIKGMREFGKRVIVNPHGLEPFQTIDITEKVKSLPIRMLEQYQFKYAAHIVSLGGHLTKILKGQVSDHGKIVVLPNAVHPGNPLKRDFDKEKLQLLFVGRFAINKGINILMEAVQQLNKEGYSNRLQFNLIGKGPLFERYRKEYAFDNVHFMGFADDALLAESYRSNDLFVFPTRFEGMPTVVLEAMASGMPIVVSDTGATAELVSSENGYLIEKNNVRALKWAIQRFYQLSPAERLKLSEASYAKVCREFTWSKIAGMHLDLFDNFKPGK